MAGNSTARRARCCGCGAAVELWQAVPTIVGGAVHVRCGRCHDVPPAEAETAAPASAPVELEVARDRRPLFALATAAVCGVGLAGWWLGGGAVEEPAVAPPASPNVAAVVSREAPAPVTRVDPAALPALPSAPVRSQTTARPAIAAEPSAADSEAPVAPADPSTEVGGRHWRLDTEHGPVHVWLSPDYDPLTADEVIYVHGYDTTVDEVWREHRLAAQFHASGRNALFIAPLAPPDNDAPVPWSRLDPLLEHVANATGAEWPRGDRVVIGHSGAFRTIARWLGDVAIDHVILLDGLYGAVASFREWLDGDDRRRLTMVANETADNARALAQHYRRDSYAGELDRDELARVGAREARVVYLRTQFHHMWLARGGEAIPAVLAGSARARSPFAVELAPATEPNLAPAALARRPDER